MTKTTVLWPLCQPTTPVSNWRILLEQSFTAHMPLLMTTSTWIREKMLEFSSTVLTAPSPYHFFHLVTSIQTSGYATMVHGRGCNQHRCTTTFANVEITSLWRHWWRHNSERESIRDGQKRRPPRAMKSSELSNGENRIALRQHLQTRKWRHLWRHNLGSRWKLQKVAWENFSIGAFYNITKNQDNPIKTVGE